MPSKKKGGKDKTVNEKNKPKPSKPKRNRNRKAKPKLKPLPLEPEPIAVVTYEENSEKLKSYFKKLVDKDGSISTYTLATDFNDTNDLPILAVKDVIIRKVSRVDVVIVVGQTASGKTTQVPQIILESGLNNDKMIAITQPRRLAAISLAQRVAFERGEPVGQTVGYAVRFDECISPETKLKFVTDGLLIKELQSDPYLSKYSVIILDEVHERTMNTDLLLSVLHKIRAARNGGPQQYLGELKIILMSATLDLMKVFRLFLHCGGVLVHPREVKVENYNVTILNSDYVTAMISKICELHNTRPIDYHILAFVAGREEINTIVTVLKSYNLENLVVLPLYSALSHEAQLRAISQSKPGYRRVIVSTNIAETSLTIPGVRIVLDCGFAKRRILRGHGFESLEIRQISQAEAYQRSGRAGRETSGICYRFYSNKEFKKLTAFPAAEVEYSSVTKMVLMVLSLGEGDIRNWPWVEEPSPASILTALSELNSFHALENTEPPFRLSKIGKEMAIAPVEPKYTAILRHALFLRLFNEAAVVVAILSSEPFIMPCKEAVEKKREHFYAGDGDLMAYYRILTAFRKSKHQKEFCRTYKFNLRALQFATKVRKQLYSFASKLDDWKEKMNEKGGKMELSRELRTLFACALPSNVAVLDDQVYRTRRPDCESIEVKIHPTSSLVGKKVRLVHFMEITELGGGIKYISHVSPIESRWVPELDLFPASF